MKGNFLYSEENDDFYRVSQNILPPIEAYTFFPTGIILLHLYIYI